MAKSAQKITLLFLGLFLGLTLAGCGKRASQVSPPDDVQEDKFPFTYPNPKTDPQPQSPDQQGTR